MLLPLLLAACAACKDAVLALRVTGEDVTQTMRAALDVAYPAIRTTSEAAAAIRVAHEDNAMAICAAHEFAAIAIRTAREVTAPTIRATREVAIYTPDMRKKKLKSDPGR